MKIYANSQDPEAIKAKFMPYVGKDIWIKMYNPYKVKRWQYIFVRPDYIGPDNWGGYLMTGESVPAQVVPSFTYYKNEIIYITDSAGYQLVEPVEAYTTAELFELDISAVVDICDQFAGAPVWIKMESPEFGLIFVNVIEFGEGYINATYIDYDCVVPDGDETWESIARAPSDHFNEDIDIPIGQLKVCTPIELLTTDELKAELVEADRQYYEYENMWG